MDGTQRHHHGHHSAERWLRRANKGDELIFYNGIDVDGAANRNAALRLVYDELKKAMQAGNPRFRLDNRASSVERADINGDHGELLRCECCRRKLIELASRFCCHPNLPKAQRPLGACLRE